MKRKWLLTGLASLAGSSVVALAVGFADAPKQDQTKKEIKDSAPPELLNTRSPASLPISQVLLYSSGVGYFEREGSVVGDARIDLTFQSQDINDLLKSMVVQDLNGGQVSTVSYDSNAPIEKTLKSFAVNLSANPSFAQILNQARGEKIEVVLLQANATQPGTLTGTLVGMETQKVASGKEPIDIEVLNLWCADGVRSLKLSEIQRVRFLNPILEGEFKKALETLALSHDTQKKAVTMNFTGEGKRTVRVGYVVENPIWKTSYRLVLDKANKAAPFLQAWAVVENPTDEDWKEVRMALISGRPISFQMNLYDPLYVTRPVVEPELFASLRPVAYSGSLQGREMAQALRFKEDKAADQDMYPLKKAGNGTQATAQQADAFRRGANSKEEFGLYWAEGGDKLGKRMDLASGVQTMATATKLGDFFQYLIDRPVNLQRQKSAMLPIISKDVEATRVSIYNERTQAKFPLLGLKFKNTSGMHLMQGPITLFEGSSYAGDARILDLQPKEERLISYAVDLGTEVSPAPALSNGRFTEIKAVKGIIYSKNMIRETRTYTIANRNDQERTILIEHPVRLGFTLVDCKADETAADVYRFEVKVAPGKTETKTITEEHVINESVRISDFNDERINFFVNQTISSQKVKDGLREAMRLRWATAQTVREVNDRQVQLKAITDDQIRLRANLKEMPATSEAYKRYIKKFDDQEVEIEKLQAEIKKLQGVQHLQQKEFEDFVNNFTAE